MAESNNLFERLSVEVIQGILCFLPDIASLRAAAITSKQLLAVVNGAKMMLITQVAVNHISPELMPEALLALESDRLCPYSIDQVDGFAESHLQNRKANPRHITLAEGVDMERRHAAVEYFAVKCSTQAQKYLPFLGELSETHYGRSFPEAKNNLAADVTKTEHNRFARAFYLLEVCYNLLGSFHAPRFYGPDHGEANISFLSTVKKSFACQFSLPELEQMAVAHDYLNDIIEFILGPFDDASMDEEIWRTNGVSYTPSVLFTTRGLFIITSDILSRGLVNLHAIAIKSIDAKLTPPSELLFPYPVNRISVPYPLFAFVIGQETWSWNDFPHPFYQDEDDGPLTIWKRVFPAAVDGESVDSGLGHYHTRAYFRRMAWVMWDEWRLGITTWENSVDDYNIRALVMKHLWYGWWYATDQEMSKDRIPRVHRCRDCREIGSILVEC